MGTTSITGLTGILLMMVFYSVTMTMFVYYMPSYVTPYGEIGTNNVNTDVTGIVNEVDISVNAQSSLPLVDIGTLLFYTGNLFFDLVLNFITALPQMFVLFFTIVLSLFPIDMYLTQEMMLFIQAVLFIVQMLGIIQLFANLRSGGGKVV